MPQALSELYNSKWKPEEIEQFGIVTMTTVLMKFEYSGYYLFKEKIDRKLFKDHFHEPILRIKTNFISTREIKLEDFPNLKKYIDSKL